MGELIGRLHDLRDHAQAALDEYEAMQWSDLANRLDQISDAAERAFELTMRRRGPIAVTPRPDLAADLKKLGTDLMYLAGGRVPGESGG